MNRSLIETWYRSAVLGAAIIVLTECAVNVYNGTSKPWPFSDERASHHRRARGFAPRIPVVQAAAASETRQNLKFEAFIPELNGGGAWLNSMPLSTKSLRGRVVLINFWTYTCINSLRPLPYVKAWSAKYKDSGLIVIGVHTPEFSFERDSRM